jgi:hypothetical protein
MDADLLSSAATQFIKQRIYPQSLAGKSSNKQSRKQALNNPHTPVSATPASQRASNRANKH